MTLSKDTKGSYVEKEREGLHQNGVPRARKKRLENVCVAKFMVAISHGRGVIECFEYERNINGELFSQFVRDSFPQIFSKGNNQKGKLFLQDGDPSQNCKMSQKAMDKIPCRLFRITPRSPDLNPIENIFHFAGRKRSEERPMNTSVFVYTNTLRNFPSDIKDGTIASMPKRINVVIKMKGQRAKY